MWMADSRSSSLWRNIHATTKAHGSCWISALRRRIRVRCLQNVRSYQIPVKIIQVSLFFKVKVKWTLGRREKASTNVKILTRGRLQQQCPCVGLTVCWPPNLKSLERWWQEGRSSNLAAADLPARCAATKVVDLTSPALLRWHQCTPLFGGECGYGVIRRFQTTVFKCCWYSANHNHGSRGIK